MNPRQSNQPLITPSHGPSSILRGSFEDRFNRSLNTALTQEGVAFASEQVRETLKISTRNFYQELHTQLFSKESRGLLSEDVEAPAGSARALISITPDQRSHLIYQRLELKLQEKANILARLIANQLRGNRSEVLNRSGGPTCIIDRSNILSISTLITGLSNTLHDDEFSDLMQSVSESSNNLDASTLEEVFNRIATIPAGSNLEALRSMSQQLIDQGQVPSGQQNNPVQFSLVTLQALNNNQQLQLADYAIAQIASNSQRAEVVLRELVTTGSLPLRVLEHKITQAAEDDQNTQMYTDIYQRVATYQSRARQELAQTQRGLASAIEIAGIGGGDISNQAFSGGAWAKLLGFYYGVLVASVNLGAGVLSGDVPAGVAGALPWAGLSALTFSHDPMGSFGRLSRRLAYNQGGRDQMTLEQRKDQLATLTLQDSNSIDIFSSDAFITVLRESLDLNQQDSALDLASFERRLRERNTSVYNEYIRNYADQFRSDRAGLESRLTEVAYAYHHLNITSHQTFIEQVASRRGFTPDMLTNLG